MPSQALDELGASDDEAGLGTAEELVAAEAAEVGAVGDAGGDRWLDVRERMRRICAQTTAAKILGHRDVEPPAQGDQIRERRPITGRSVDQRPLIRPIVSPADEA